MKMKTLPKTLSIKKHTVANLNGTEMKDIQGGGISKPTLDDVCMSVIILCPATLWIGCVG